MAAIIRAVVAEMKNSDALPRRALTETIVEYRCSNATTDPGMSSLRRC
jgi:hypothetical protein